MCIKRTFIKNYGKMISQRTHGVTMTTVKVMSIIAIVLFSIGFISIIALSPVNEYDLTATELENMMPWEREIYVSLLQQYIEEENLKAQQERNG